MTKDQIIAPRMGMGAQIICYYTDDDDCDCETDYKWVVNEEEGGCHVSLRRRHMSQKYVRWALENKQ